MLARSVFIRTFSADFRIFLRYVFFHFRPFSPFLSRFCARTISGNQPLTSPSYYPVIPGAHTFLLSLSLYHTHINTHLTKNQKQSLVCFPVNHSLVFSLSGSSVERKVEGFGGGGQVSLPWCPGTVRGRLGLIWALIPSPLPGDPRTNLM